MQFTRWPLGVRRFPQLQQQPCSSSSAAANMQLFSHFFLDTVRVFLMILRICITSLLFRTC